jgi:hypothetical protein
MGGKEGLGKGTGWESTQGFKEMGFIREFHKEGEAELR